MMYNFTYYTPTRVVFGKGAEEQAGALVKAQGSDGEPLRHSQTSW